VEWLFQTHETFAFVILRFGLALTFFMHGTQHVFGWHGGKGAMAQVTNWRDKYHIPLPIGIFALVIELSTVVSMTLGFLVKPVAFCLAVFIGFALVLGHWSHGFFLANAPGRGSGIEYTLALFLMAIAVTVGGAGLLSIDSLLSR